MATIWPNPISHSSPPEAVQAAPQSLWSKAFVVTSHSRSSKAPRGQQRGLMGEGHSAIISFPTGSLQKPGAPQQFFPGGKCPCLVSAQRRISMESLRKIPSGWGCEKSLSLSHLEKKERTYLRGGYFCLRFRRRWLEQCSLGLLSHHSTGEREWNRPCRGEANPKMLMCLLKNLSFF